MGSCTTKVKKIVGVAPLPVRNGVSPSRVFLPAGTWSTYYDFFIDRFPHLPEEALKNRLQNGDVVNAHGYAVKPCAPYQSEQWLWYYREVPAEQRVPFECPVLFHNKNIVVIDKPHFLPSIPSGNYLHETALVRTRNALELPQLSPLHRLDRETAGIMMFCVNPEYRGAYQTLFQRQAVHKVYEAVAPLNTSISWPLEYSSRIVAGDGFLMKQTAGSSNSHTHIELTRQLSANGLALYTLRPTTGRKHQLRVHLCSLGIPIVNDSLYPVMWPDRLDSDFSKPLQLLARSVSFTDPVTGEQHYFESKRRLFLHE